MIIPPGDRNLALTVHSYTPWDFAGPGPTTIVPPSTRPQHNGPTNHTFTAEDETAARATMSSLAAWGQRKLGDPSRVVHDEFGCTVMQSNRTARLLYYKTYARAAEAAGVGWAVWDDDGWYRVLSRRANQTWDADVLAQLVPPSSSVVGKRGVLAQPDTTLFFTSPATPQG